MSTAARPTTLALAASLALASIHSACIHTKKHGMPPPQLRTIAYGYHTGLKTPVQLVVRSAEDWWQVWQKHHSQTIPTPPLPKVDFTREMVLGVAVGQRPTGGYGVRILETRFESGRLVVEVHETRPPEGAVVPMVLSQPYEFVKVPRFDGEVEFVVN